MSSTRLESLRTVWLEAFVAAVELGSYAEASRFLNCDRSMISRYIASLEDFYKTALFDEKNSDGLSAKGRHIFDTAKIVLFALDVKTPSDHNILVDGIQGRLGVLLLDLAKKALARTVSPNVLPINISAPMSDTSGMESPRVLAQQVARATSR